MNHSIHAKQHGSVLIVSLMILLVLTLIGVTAMGVSTLEEKMAGNSRDQALGFQAAEAALRDAETLLNGIATTGAFNNTNGLYATGQAPDIFANATWTGSASRTGTAVPNVPNPPRFIVEFVGVTGRPTPMLESGYGDSSGGGQITNFRITARGTGGTDSATVLLQEYYGMRL
ncbi:MAG: pilus assembly protein PilX [Gammaproteobacteria bacterium]|nr:pilus assembly protein PilX [Gammaproteobacteria bacterium]